MPKRFPCPNCGVDVITWMRIGEAATCANCDTASEVPQDAAPTDEQNPTPDTPTRSSPEIRHTGWRRSNLDAQMPLMKMGFWGATVICLAVVCGIVGLANSELKDGGWIAVLFIWAPILLVAGIGLIVAGRVVTALNGIRDEMRGNSRADEDRPSE